MMRLTPFILGQRSTGLPARWVFRTSSIRGNANLARSVVEEKEDVTAMDKLLKAVSEFLPSVSYSQYIIIILGQEQDPILHTTREPRYHLSIEPLKNKHRIIPMRTPGLWSETLLNAAPDHTRDRTLERKQAPHDPPLPRNMHDSYTELVLPFGSSSSLLEEYTNATGGIRTGKSVHEDLRINLIFNNCLAKQIRLMEHLDSLAGSISYKHMLGPAVETLGRIQERGFYIVTASVDRSEGLRMILPHSVAQSFSNRLDMLAPLNPGRDLRLSGQVIYTGISSMEVAVKMETIGMDQPEETVLLGTIFCTEFILIMSDILAGRFSMVCRDANTHRARQVNPLVISTPEERALHSMGECAYCLRGSLPHSHRQFEVIKQRRQSLALRSLSRVPPSSGEAEALHSFYLSFLQEDTATLGNVPINENVWIGDTRLEKCMLMFPQERK